MRALQQQAQHAGAGAAAAAPTQLSRGAALAQQHARRRARAPAAPQQQCRSVAAAAMGGRGGFGDSPLILPGGGRPGGGPGPGSAGTGRLILPGQPRPGAPGGPGGAGGRLGLDDGAPPSGPGTLPPANKYRPPPGFMNKEVQDPALVAADPQEMVGKLRSRAGPWHALAKLLPVLYAKGFDTNTIAELTGINPVDQNNWVVAGTVYDSIAATPDADAGVLAAFDVDGDAKLYHFRFLPAERRSAAAKYIVANGLEARECDVLARAMKEWDRRPGERAGFTDSPGDCMAFKYLRDAIECRQAEQATEKLQLAFAVAESEGAAERLTEWQQTELATRSSAAASSAASSRALLQVLRLQQDELGFRPLPQISQLSAATLDELLHAPRTSQEGAFGAFELQADAGPARHKWVALPQWKALALARHPVAVPLQDCAADPAVLAASRAKTEEEKKKLTGVGLLIVDTVVQGPLDPNAFYLIAAPPGAPRQLELVDGASVTAEPGGAGPVATVLFLCRPPNRESAITSAELLQL